jgi:glycerol-3-phosphate O-acyltransferase
MKMSTIVSKIAKKAIDNYAFLAKLLLDQRVLTSNEFEIKSLDKTQKIFKRLLSLDTSASFSKIVFITIAFC